MEIKAKTRTEQILLVMHILAYVAMIGLAIEAGAIIISFGVSTFNPEAAKDLYKGMSLFSLRGYDFWQYTLAVSFIVALIAIKAYVSYLVIKLLSKMNIKNPFTQEVAHLMERISHVIFGACLVAMLNNIQIGWLLKHTGVQHGEWVSGEFIFLAGVVFVIAQIFKRGVEIQSENELTV